MKFRCVETANKRRSFVSKHFFFPVRILPLTLHTQTSAYDRRYKKKEIKNLLHNALKIQLAKI